MARASLKDVIAHFSASTRRLNPSLQANGKAPAPIAEPRPQHGPLAESQTQAPDPRKRLVRIKSSRVRLLDEDNLIAKFHIDALRYAGILLGDDPSQARILVWQEKVAKKTEEKTEIEVDIILD